MCHRPQGENLPAAHADIHPPLRADRHAEWVARPEAAGAVVHLFQREALHVIGFRRDDQIVACRLPRIVETDRHQPEAP